MKLSSYEQRIKIIELLVEILEEIKKNNRILEHLET